MISQLSFTIHAGRMAPGQPALFGVLQAHSPGSSGALMSELLHLMKDFDLDIEASNSYVQLGVFFSSVIVVPTTGGLETLVKFAGSLPRRPAECEPHDSTDSADGPIWWLEIDAGDLKYDVMMALLGDDSTMSLRVTGPKITGQIRGASKETVDALLAKLQLDFPTLQVTVTDKAKSEG